MVVFQIGNDNLKSDVKNCVTGRGPRHYSIFTIFKTFQKSEPKLLEKLQKTCRGPGPLHIRKHRYVLYRICRGPGPLRSVVKSIPPSLPPSIHPSSSSRKINFYREQFDLTENQQIDSFSVIFHSFSCRGAAHDVLSSLAENQQIRLLLCDFSLLILSRGGPRRVFVTKTIKEALKNPVAGRDPRRANSRPVLGTHDQFFIY